MRRLSLNALRLETSVTGSVATRRLQAEWDESYLETVLAGIGSMRQPCDTDGQEENLYLYLYSERAKGPYLTALQLDADLFVRPGQDPDRTLATRLAGLYRLRALLGEV